MKPDIKNGCDPKLLDPYCDAELSIEESNSVKAHLNGCPACRARIEGRHKIAGVLRTEINRALSHTNFDRVEEQIIRKIRKERLKEPSWLQRLFFSKSFFMPVSALTAALLIFFFIYNPLSPEPVPSALINSFTGSISSAMIIETPETRHTILWFSEDSTLAGEENAAHQT
jgi:anti-sigma factor RsiW